MTNPQCSSRARVWPRLFGSFSLLPLALAACAPAQPAEAPPASATSLTPAAPPSAAPVAAPGAGYSGLGLASVTPEVLAQFAPTPLPSDVSRRIQAMLDVRAPGAGQLSPDGKTLYFGWQISGTRQIWRIDGPQKFPVQMTGGEDPTLLAGITPDGKTLIVSRDRKGEENPGLYLQPAIGGPLTVVQHKAGVQTNAQLVTDDGRYLYFRANDITPSSYAIYRYDLGTKQRELVFDREGIWSVADDRPDGRLLLLKEIGSNMGEYFEWDPTKKALTPLFGQGEREDYMAAYGAGEGEVIVHTPKLGEYRRLYVWKAGKLTPITPELKYDVHTFSIDQPKQRIVYQINEGGYLRLRAIDAKTFKELKLPAIPPADQVGVGATTRNGRFSTLSVDMGQDPPASYVVEWKTGKLVQWHLPSAPEIDTRRFARRKLEQYPARDGTMIPMFVRRPTACEKPGSAGAVPCPVVVDFHGGPEAQTMAGFHTRGQLFVDAGFIYVEPNVRGSDGYGKTWIHADDGAKRLSVITDIEDCATHIRAKWSEGGVGPKIGIMGGSYGGYSSLMGMTMFAGAYDAGAEVVGISNLVTFLQNTAPYRRPLRISEYGDPDKDRELLTKLSPTTYLDRVKAPLLLIQGANDPRVPVGEAVQVYNALQAKKLAAKLMIFADEGHGAQKRENQVLTLGHMVRFFEEHLKGKTAH